ncbi:MAG TPA: type III pantothenate kinase [Candidatus Omnitrophota bacterium]|nr:type III pantothenate kinase [Candidatus Omnitrophota bacterium]
MKRKILIDVGNTNTSIAFAEGKTLKHKCFIRTAKKEIDPSSLKRLLGRWLPVSDEIVAVQVVPDFFRALSKSLAQAAPDLPVRVIGKDIKVPMKIRYKDPSQVGQDRLVTSYGGVEAYGFPLIMIDFGTAVTFDYVGDEGVYEGGLIFPGLRIALEALSSKAALLPKIELHPARELVGRDTQSSITSGVLYGFAGACDGIVEKLKRESASTTKVIATGGDASLVARYAGSIDKVHKDIIFEALISLSGE